MMGSQPASAASACGRSRPWVSEIAPLDQNAPQLARLVRNAAHRAEQFSQDLRDQTVEGTAPVKAIQRVTLANLRPRRRLATKRIWPSGNLDNYQSSALKCCGWRE
jgi:hypothetical protein